MYLGDSSVHLKCCSQIWRRPTVILFLAFRTSCDLIKWLCEQTQSSMIMFVCTCVWFVWLLPFCPSLIIYNETNRVCLCLWIIQLPLAPAKTFLDFWWMYIWVYVSVTVSVYLYFKCTNKVKTKQLMKSLFIWQLSYNVAEGTHSAHSLQFREVSGI